MKKLLAVLFISVMLMSVSVMPAFASNHSQGEWIYEEEFVKKHFSTSDQDTAEYVYEELYYKYKDEPNPDAGLSWVLVKCSLLDYVPQNIKQNLGDMVMISNKRAATYGFDYAVYDVSRRRFFGLSEELYDRYKGLKKAVESIKIAHPIGDADFDFELSILDATKIQLALAQLCEFEKSDDLRAYTELDSTPSDKVAFVSDFNRDGIRDIFDATAIQLHLVGRKPDPDYGGLLFKDICLFDQEDEEFPVAPYGYEIDFEFVRPLPLISEKLKYRKEFIALVTDLDQYLTLFKDDDPVFDEAFFEENALVITNPQCIDHYMTAPISKIAVKDNVLCVEFKINYPTGEYLHPTAPFDLSVVRVSMKDVEGVTKIYHIDIPERPTAIIPDEPDYSIIDGSEFTANVPARKLTGSKNVYCLIVKDDGDSRKSLGSEDLFADDHVCHIWREVDGTIGIAYDIPESYEIEKGETYKYYICNESRTVLKMGSYIP